MTTFYKDPQLKEPEKEIKMSHQTHSGGFSFERNITEKNRYSTDEMIYEYSYVKSKQKILDWTKCTVNELHIIIPLKPHNYQMVRNFILPVESDPTKSFNVTLDVGKNLNILVKAHNICIFDYVILYKKLLAFFSFLGITRFMREIRNNYHIHAHMISKDNRYYLNKSLSQSMCSIVKFKHIINIINEDTWDKWLAIYSRMFHLNMDLINFAYTRLIKKNPNWNEHIWYSRIFDFFEIGFRSLIKINNLPSSYAYRKKFYELDKKYLLKSSLLRQCSGIDLEHFEIQKSKESSKKIVVRDDYEKIIELAVSIRNYHRHGYFEDSKKSLEGWLDLYSDSSLIDLGNYLYSLIWLSLIKEFNSTISFNIMLQNFKPYSISLEDISPYPISDSEFL